MFRVEYDFRLHKYRVVEGGTLTLIEAERCRADKTSGLKQHAETHHRQKIAELHAFLTKTYSTREAVIQFGPDGFYDDWERLATTALNEPSTPLEAKRLVGRRKQSV